MRTEIVKVPYRVWVDIPEELTRPCMVPVFSGDKDITYGDVVNHSLLLMGVVENCNNKLKLIRELEEVTE